MKKLLIISILLSSTILSCKKKALVTQGMFSEATIYNYSGVSVRYIPYNAGRADAAYTVDITDGDSLYLGKSFSLAQTEKGPGFSSDYSTGKDSIQIVFDDKYIMNHVSNFPDTLLKSHHIPFGHERSIRYPFNYKWWYVDEAITMYHQYVFTEEDYNYAKENGRIIE